MEKKKNILKSQGRCYLCLKSKHRILKCTKNIDCKYCSLKHNQEICYKFNNSLKKDKRSESRTDQAYSKDEIVSTVFPM